MTEQKGSIREQIDARKFGKPMKQALRRVLIGQSYRDAAAAEGVDHAYLWRAVGTFSGFHEEHLRAWRATWGQEFPPAWQQHLRKLDSPAPGAQGWKH